MKTSLRSFSLVLVLIFSNSTFAASSNDAVNSALMEASLSGNQKLLKKTLSNKSANINFQDSDGMSPLMNAAINGKDKVVSILIQHKANLELKNIDGDTALAIALTNDQFPLATQLIKAGSNVDILVAGENKDTLLIRAAGINTETSSLIVQKNKTVLNKTNNLGETALMRSIEYGTLDIAKMLIKNGADTKIKNKAGKTALDIAKESKNSEAIKLLSK